jgi:hypothetical protein
MRVRARRALSHGGLLHSSWSSVAASESIPGELDVQGIKSDALLVANATPVSASVRSDLNSVDPDNNNNTQCINNK